MICSEIFIIFYLRPKTLSVGTVDSVLGTDSGSGDKSGDTKKFPEIPKPRQCLAEVSPRGLIFLIKAGEKKLSQ